MGCTEMRLVEKADSMLHVTWTPPDIFEPEYRHLHTHYRVTIEPVDGYSMRPDARKNYTVMGEGEMWVFYENEFLSSAWQFHQIHGLATRNFLQHHCAGRHRRWLWPTSLGRLANIANGQNMDFTSKGQVANNTHTGMGPGLGLCAQRLHCKCFEHWHGTIEWTISFAS